jgi:malate dehydrogenase (oxaloacetate-decarboxylating)(NADP+)
VSSVGGAFNKDVVEAMSKINERPVILALSNPTEHAECTPKQAYTWSKGKAIACSFRRCIRRPDVPAGAGEQFLHFPGDRHGDLRNPGQARDRRNVHRSRQGRCGSGVGFAFEPGAPLSLAVEYARDRDQDRLAHREAVFDEDLARVDGPSDMDAFIRHRVYKPQYATVQ